MFKTFLIGILLGIAAAAGALYAIPAVDQHREVSIVSVAPNGGNSESFHINIPMDRVMAGGQGQTAALPAELAWPQDTILADFGAELFKVRNARDAVVGIAARTVAKHDGAEIIDWVIHLPARGSVYVNMNPIPQEGGYRVGQIRSGTREFATLSGAVSERWVSDTSGEEDAPAGRVELAAIYVGRAEPEAIE